MACSKYTLTNTGSTTVNFSYQRCDDALWDYQVELAPNQTKNIWVINGTYTVAPAFKNVIYLVNQGVFPPVAITPTPTQTPSATPTNTPTPSVTATNTPTPSTTLTSTPTPTVTPTNTPSETPTQTPSETPTNTPTNTPSETPTNTPTNTSTSTPTNTPTNTGTPTNTPSVTPTNTPTPSPTDPQPARYEFVVYHSETSAEEACYTDITATVFGNAPTFQQTADDYGFFFGCSSGLCPEVNLSGYYVDGGETYQLDSSGNVGAIAPCGITPTPTVTPSVTPTNTPTPTQTIGYYQYSLGTGATSFDACTDLSPVTVYGTVAGGTGPNVGETLYVNSGLSVPVMNGFYSNGTRWYQVTGGAGLITLSNLC